MREVTLIDYASNPTASWQKSDRDTALRKLLCDILGSPTAKGYAHGKLIWMFKDARGRRVTPTERRQQVVQAFRASGLTMAAFARRERLKYATFAGWVAKAQRTAVPKGPIEFAELRMPFAAATPLSGDHLDVPCPISTI